MRSLLLKSSVMVAVAVSLISLDILEDLAGNRVGRAFEVDRFDRADVTREPERTSIPIIVS